MSLGHRKIGDKIIDSIIDDIYRVLNTHEKKLNRFNVITDDNNKAFLEIITNEGVARSAIDVFQLGSGNHTILGDFTNNIPDNLAARNITGSQIYNLVSYIPKRYTLDYSEFGGDYQLFTVHEGYVIDKIDVIVLTAFNNSAQFRINDGTDDIITNTQTSKILSLAGRHEFKINYSKYTEDSLLTLYTTNSPSAGNAVILIHYRSEEYDTKTAV